MEKLLNIIKPRRKPDHALKVCRLFEEMASWREAALRSWNQPQLAALYNEKAELILLEIKELQK